MSRRIQTRSVMLLAILLAFGSITACAHDYTTQRTLFTANGNELHGTIALPTNTDTPVPVVIFVHGDGPADAHYLGYYDAFWRALSQRGIASFAWDKPGVGDSTGQWLNQSMDDRAEEVRAAARHLRDQAALDADSIGVVGYSQAGWVLPRLAAEPWLDYFVFISTAIDWQQQGRYLRDHRLQALSRSDVDGYAKAIDHDREITALLLDEQSTYSDYLSLHEQLNESACYRESAMSPERFAFARRNSHENATQALAGIDVPVLALFGDDDLNVDINHSLSIYRSVFKQDDTIDFAYRILPGATHQLTKSQLYNRQVPGLWYLILLHLMGDDLFVAGALETVAMYIEAQVFP